MKQLLLLCAFAILVATGASAQNTFVDQLGYLGEDFDALMDSVGQNVAPQLFQAAISSDIVGEAAFKGAFPHGTFTLLGVGVQTGEGIARVLDDGARDWKFMIPLPSLLQTALGNDTFTMARRVFPYPAVGVGLGFGIVKDVEVLVNGIFLPSAVADLLGGLNSTVKKLSPTMSALGLSGKVRKVFFHDTKTSPAISLSLGGAYSSFSLGAAVKLSDIMGKLFELQADANGNTTLELEGPFSLASLAYGGGVEFHISKNLPTRIPLFTPFAKVGLWYRYARFTSDLDLTATIVNTNTTTVPETITETTAPIAANPTTELRDLSAILSGGFELRLLPVAIHVSLGLDLESPIVDIAALNLTGIHLNGLSLKTGIRFAF